MSDPTVLSVAVCLFADAQLLDYGGPLDLLGFLNADDTHRKRTPSHLLRLTYVGPSEIVQPTAGPRVLMDATYEKLVSDSSKQFDVIFVPGGWGTTPRVVPPALLQFLQKQAPGARYILSVCTGSWLLAQAGLLDGKRATTNKALFDVFASRTESSIDCVHHARWVVDGKYWTASGVTAGTQRSLSALDTYGNRLGHGVRMGRASRRQGRRRAAIEHAPRAQDDDEFAGAWTSEKQKTIVEVVKDQL